MRMRREFPAKVRAAAFERAGRHLAVYRTDDLLTELQSRGEIRFVKTEASVTRAALASDVEEVVHRQLARDLGLALLRDGAFVISKKDDSANPLRTVLTAVVTYFIDRHEK